MATRILDGEILTSRFDDVRLYDGVRTRRVLAFVLDYLIVGLLCIPFAIIVALLGIITLGLGWALFGVLGPVVALFYVAATLGGREQATLGMRMMSIRLERLDGGSIGPVIAVVHTVLFWAGNVILTPLILLATLFLDRKRTLHDLLLGTVVVRTDK
ncbi:putative RDD family membrane protein YckC [Mesorhizobium sp. J18]|uniref:RDD family protein n=1 Tax=Mesorhizobium sp. J18 TaxID=935263 RepID=UPI00119A0415|nr:RDD family protein [Mesorhizobium sp. J18]TWH01296.1 putative RDD family membrane protein YckC [Mesorhizobium sp. J18]